MTAPQMRYDSLLALAAETGCSGVEFRNDLSAPLFDGDSPEQARASADAAGIAILTIAEIKSFNDWSDEKAAEANALMQTAAACGAKAVSLIPRNDGQGLGNGERQANLRIALRELTPLLQQHGLLGYVEPLGFEQCSMQYKSEAVEIIEALRAEDQIKLVHDTFHHHLAGGGPVFPEHTALVHISGVIDPDLSVREMGDAHRGLVDGQDRLGNLAQIEDLMAGGYSSPISIEAFAPEVHAFTDPKSEILRSFSFIETSLGDKAA
ncbi:MAG: TIM barrel protein [Pseudomonadota bacterium]